MEFSWRPYHAYYTTMVCPCPVEEDHHYAHNRFCWCLSLFQTKTALRPVKFDERSGDMVNLGEICNFHVHAMLLLCRCQVLTASNTFLLGFYYVPITRAPGQIKSYHVLAMPKKISSHTYNLLTVSIQSLPILWHMLLYFKKSRKSIWPNCSLLSGKGAPNKIWVFFYSLVFSFEPSKGRPLHQGEYDVLEEEQVAVEMLNFWGSY